MLQFYLGPSGSGKSTRLYNHIIEESMKNPDILYYIIVPEQSNLQTQQKLVKMHPRGGIINIDVLSFNRLAHRVFEETGYGSDGGRVIDDCGKNLVLRRVAQLHKNELEILGENLDRLGYITGVKSVISEFMQYGISIDKSKELSQISRDNNNEKLSLKLSDISLLYEQFLSFIKDNYTTREELMIRLSKVLPDSSKIKKTVCIFDGFTGFTPVQLTVIDQLLVLCKDVVVSLNYDSRQEDDLMLKETDLFYLSKHTIKTLGKMADLERVVQLDPVVIKDEYALRFNNDELRHLERNLFRDSSKQFVRRGALDSDNKDGLASDTITENIAIIKALNPDEEMECVARKIKDLVRVEGYKYSDIAIITGDLESYRSPAERALTLCGIPYFTDKTQPILLNPMIEYLRAVIAVLSNNYSYEAVFRLLKSGLMDISLRDIDEFENYVIAAGIKGRASYNKPFAYLPKVYRNADTDIKAEYLLRINDVRIRIADLFGSIENDIADRFNAGTKARVKVIATAIYNMLLRENIAFKMSKKAEAFANNQDDYRAKNFSQIYERVMKVFEQLVELLGDEKLTISEFGQLLESGFDEIRIGIIPTSSDYVQLGDLTRSRAGDIKALFLVGANDGLIPKKMDSGGLLTDEDKDFLQGAIPDIAFSPTAKDNAYTQRLYLYMMLTQPKDKLFISYSKVNQQGESIRCSYLIRVIDKLFGKVKVIDASGKGIKELSDKESAFKMLSLSLDDYLKGNLTDKSDYELLASYFSSQEVYRERFLNVILNNKYKATGKISKAVAAALYSHRLYLSVTRLETYAECAYQYFLKYGLKLSEREEYDFAARDLGSAFHASLERYVNLLKERNINNLDVSEEISKEIMDEAVEYVIASNEMASVYSSSRMAYTVSRIKRIMARTASILSYQAKKGLFKPHAVEVDFAAISDLEALNLKISDEDSIRLFGRIDRIDTCKEGDVTYVRVIDYKSGDTDLQLQAVYEGRQLQLVMYLATALEMVAKSDGGKVLPAGILYYHIDDPMIKSSEIKDTDDIEAVIRKKLKMKGFVNSDRHIITLNDAEIEKESDILPISLKKDKELSANSKVLSTDEFGDLMGKARETIVKLGESIVSGDIKTAKEAGYLTDYPDTCKYCDYKSVCRQKGEMDYEYEEGDKE